MKFGLSIFVITIILMIVQGQSKEQEILNENSNCSLDQQSSDSCIQNLNPLPKPLLIGVSGGSASGKTSLCKYLIDHLLPNCCSHIQLDNFYKLIPKGTDFSKYDFDASKSFDFDLAYQVLKKHVNNEEVDGPIWDYKTHDRSKQWEKILPTKIIFYEGIFAFQDERIMDMFDIKIFVDLDDDIRLGRRIMRDVNERGRDVQGIVNQYLKFVKPAFDEHIKPKAKFADFILRGDNWDKTASRLFHQYLETELIKRESQMSTNSHEI